MQRFATFTKTYKVLIEMTEKQKYIGAYMDGYMNSHGLEYGFKYLHMLEIAEKKAKKSWKKYKPL